MPIRLRFLWLAYLSMARWTRVRLRLYLGVFIFVRFVEVVMDGGNGIENGERSGGGEFKRKSIRLHTRTVTAIFINSTTTSEIITQACCSTCRSDFIVIS